MSDDASPNGQPVEIELAETAPSTLREPVTNGEAPSPPPPVTIPLADTAPSEAVTTQEPVPSAPKPRKSRAKAPTPASTTPEQKAVDTVARTTAKKSRKSSAKSQPATPPVAEEPAPPKARSRRRTPAPVIEAAEPPPASSPVGPADQELPIRGVAPTQNPAPFWSDRTADTPPPEPPTVGFAAAETLYEVELELRNQAAQSTGEDAALSSMAAGTLRLISDNLRRMTEQQADKVTEMLRGIDLKDYLDPDFWKGIGMVVRYQLDEQVNFIKRRLNGEYTTDPYGMDRELIEVVLPFLNFLYRTWWRVSTEGLENVPAEGRGLLVANHSGVLPWDGAMIAMAIHQDHPSHNERIVRSLHLHWFSTLPFVAPTLAALGQVPGIPENAIRLLESDELVCVFPEGLKGVGKLYRDRYKLARFGRGGFVQAAIRAQAPIVPVAVVGAEEIYPMLANVEPLAKILGMPYFPITPFFPWLGPLGVVPLPTRWSITFGEPLRTDMYDPAEADDPLTVLGLTEIVRGTIQESLSAKVAARKGVF